MSDKADKEGRKRRKSRHNNDNENRGSKKKKVGPLTGIAMSKQLSEKMKRTRSTRTSASRSSTGRKTMEPRLCGNGRPMPTLQDLERMFEDSDDDGEASAPTSNAIAQPVRCATPEPQPITISEDKLLSPTTIKQIANKLMEKIEKYPTIILDDDPPPPIVPPKKRKKSDTPYIVGCKERVQVPWQPKTSFCKGDPKYGVDQNGKQSSDEDSPKKRRKMSKHINISKSIFNAKTDEIVAMLANSNNVEAPGSGSPDSNKTVEYDLNSNSPLQQPRSFSPLPSTSRDVDTITKNDERFNESILSENLSKDESQNDIEVIEAPCETIVIDETTPSRNYFVGPLCRPSNYDDDDDCCVIVPSEDVKKRNTTSPIKVYSPKDDIYPSLDLTNFDTEIIEVIDVEDVIAENKVIIDKYKQRNRDTVILVEPNTSYTAKISTQGSNRSLDNVTDNSSNSREQPTQQSNIQNNVTESTTKDIPPLPCIEVESVEVNNAHNYSSNIPVNSNTNANIISNVVTDFFNASGNRTGNICISQGYLQDTLLESMLSIVSSLSALQTTHTSTTNNDGTHSHTSNVTQTSEPVIFENTSGSQFSCNNTLVLPRHSRRGNNNTPTRREHTSTPSGRRHNGTPTRRGRNSTSTGRGHISTPPGRGCNGTLNVRQHGLDGNFVVTNVSYVPANMHFGNRSHTASIVTTSSYERPVINNAPSNIASICHNNSLPEQELDQNNGLLNRDCPICMESLSKGPIASTLCGHIFCMNCIKQAIRANGRKCPTCRKNLKGIGYHQLFL